MSKTTVAKRESLFEFSTIAGVVSVVYGNSRVSKLRN